MMKALNSHNLTFNKSLSLLMLSVIVAACDPVGDAIDDAERSQERNLNGGAFDPLESAAFQNQIANNDTDRAIRQAREQAEIAAANDQRRFEHEQALTERQLANQKEIQELELQTRLQESQLERDQFESQLETRRYESDNEVAIADREASSARDARNLESQNSAIDSLSKIGESAIGETGEILQAMNQGEANKSQAKLNEARIERENAHTDWLIAQREREAEQAEQARLDGIRSNAQDAQARVAFDNARGTVKEAEELRDQAEIETQAAIKARQLALSVKNKTVKNDEGEEVPFSWSDVESKIVNQSLSPEVERRVRELLGQVREGDGLVPGGYDALNQHALNTGNLKDELDKSIKNWNSTLGGEYTEDEVNEFGGAVQDAMDGVSIPAVLPLPPSASPEQRQAAQSALKDFNESRSNSTTTGDDGDDLVFIETPDNGSPGKVIRKDQYLPEESDADEILEKAIRAGYCDENGKCYEKATGMVSYVKDKLNEGKTLTIDGDEVTGVRVAEGFVAKPGGEEMAPHMDAVFTVKDSETGQTKEVRHSSTGVIFGDEVPDGDERIFGAAPDKNSSTKSEEDPLAKNLGEIDDEVTDGAKDVADDADVSGVAGAAGSAVEGVAAATNQGPGGNSVEVGEGAAVAGITQIGQVNYEVPQSTAIPVSGNGFNSAGIANSGLPSNSNVAGPPSLDDLSINELSSFSNQLRDQLISGVDSEGNEISDEQREELTSLLGDTDAIRQNKLDAATLGEFNEGSLFACAGSGVCEVDHALGMASINATSQMLTELKTAHEKYLAAKQAFDSDQTQASADALNAAAEEFNLFNDAIASEKESIANFRSELEARIAASDNPVEKVFYQNSAQLVARAHQRLEAQHGKFSSDGNVASSAVELDSDLLDMLASSPNFDSLALQAGSLGVTPSLPPNYEAGFGAVRNLVSKVGGLADNGIVSRIPGIGGIANAFNRADRADRARDAQNFRDP